VRDDLNGVSKIIRVDRVTGRPLFHLVQRAAAVLEDLVIDDVDLTGRRQGRNQAGNTVHDQARLALAFTEGLLRDLALCDVLNRADEQRSARDELDRVGNGVDVLHVSARGDDTESKIEIFAGE
jgi:hypothetical protein